MAGVAREFVVLLSLVVGSVSSVLWVFVVVSGLVWFWNFAEFCWFCCVADSFVVVFAVVGVVVNDGHWAVTMTVRRLLWVRSH